MGDLSPVVDITTMSSFQQALKSDSTKVSTYSSSTESVKGLRFLQQRPSAAQVEKSGANNEGSIIHIISLQAKTTTCNEEYCKSEIRPSFILSQSYCSTNTMGQADEFIRIASFKNIGNYSSKVHALPLAKAGFSLTGYGKIKCESCQKEVHLEAIPADVDSAFEFHLQLSPNCKFLKASTKVEPFVKMTGAYAIDTHEINVVNDMYGTTEQESQPFFDKTKMMKTSGHQHPTEPAFDAAYPETSQETGNETKMSKSKRRRLRKKKSRTDETAQELRTTFDSDNSRSESTSDPPASGQDSQKLWDHSYHLKEGHGPAKTEEIKELEESISTLKEARLCKICYDKNMDTVFLPCGHFTCCSQCAAAVKDCPVCRTLIKATVPVKTTTIS